MINALLKGIFTLIIKLVNLLLLPIDSLIDSALPSVSTALGYVSGFFAFLSDFVVWIMSWFHLPVAFISFVVGYYTLKLTVPLLVQTVKLAISWYDKLKP